jgi:hypothetical protein
MNTEGKLKLLSVFICVHLWFNLRNLKYAISNPKWT